MTHVSYLCAILKNVEMLRLYTSMPHRLVTFFLILPLGVRVSHRSNVYFDLRNYTYHWVKAIAWIEFVIVSVSNSYPVYQFINHCKYLLCQCRLKNLNSIFIGCSDIFPKVYWYKFLFVTFSISTFLPDEQMQGIIEQYPTFMTKIWFTKYPYEPILCMNFFLKETKP